MNDKVPKSIRVKKKFHRFAMILKAEYFSLLLSNCMVKPNPLSTLMKYMKQRIIVSLLDAPEKINKLKCLSRQHKQ